MLGHSPMGVAETLRAAARASKDPAVGAALVELEHAALAVAIADKELRAAEGCRDVVAHSGLWDTPRVRRAQRLLRPVQAAATEAHQMYEDALHQMGALLSVAALFPDHTGAGSHEVDGLAG